MRYILASLLLLFGLFARGQDSTFSINSISIEGNKTTKNYIIEKEITFQRGEFLSITDLRDKALRSKQNLINTSLFNFADIDWTIDSNQFNIKIKVKERWYTWPQPILIGEDRNTFDWLQYRTFDRFSYGLYLNRYNFRGRQETVQLKLKFGYSQELGILYKIPYLVKTRNHGLNLSFLSVQRHEIYFKSVNDKIVYYKNSERIMRKEINTFIEYVFRYKLYHQHFARIQYDFVQVDDTITHPTENPNYLVNAMNSASYFTFKYLYRFDKRDSKNYPLTGHDIELEFNQFGINFSDNEIHSTMFSALAEKFGKFNAHFFYGLGFKTKAYLSDKVPFYIARGLGFNNDFVRGYEPYMISGSNFIVFKTNLKWQLYNPRVYKVKFIPFEKFNTFNHAFYLNVFADAGYIKDKMYTANNKLGNTMLIGYGIGLDFVTYYDKVMRIEFSTNRKGQSGIYFSFIAPI